MTRLTSKDVTAITGKLGDYDAELLGKTGYTLKGLACRAAGFDETRLEERAGKSTLAVIPVSTGLGVIAGFCEAVAAVVAHVGCRTFITRKTDVAGMIEAVEKEARLVMLADDHFFVVIHHAAHWFMDNASATALGFVTGLRLMAGGNLEGRKVLVIGCGQVGRQAVTLLLSAGANISIYDTNKDSYDLLFEALDDIRSSSVHLEKSLEDGLRGHRLILDASPAANIIHAGHIADDTLVSAPGVPLGLDRDAVRKIGGRLLHDPLQIGVAVMAVSALKACHER